MDAQADMSTDNFVGFVMLWLTYVVILHLLPIIATYTCSPHNESNKFLPWPIFLISEKKLIISDCSSILSDSGQGKWLTNTSRLATWFIDPLLAVLHLWKIFHIPTSCLQWAPVFFFTCHSRLETGIHRVSTSQCHITLQQTVCEPPHDKTNKMACAPSEDLDQPGHPPSLIRVFAIRMKKAWVLSYPFSASEDSD